MDRRRIADLILGILSKRSRLRARQLAADIRLRPGMEETDVHQVNSVLYRDLSGLVVQNSNYEWTAGQLASSQSDTQLGTVAQAKNGDLGSCLRAIQRLRSGLPPIERLPEITVGNHSAAVQPVLRGGQPGRGWLAVVGDYGHGKTHTLALFHDQAHDAGYATCHLSADAAAAALNHPQRFMPLLLSTLGFPGERLYGYQDLLQELLDDEKTRKVLLASATARLPEASQLRRELVRALIELAQTGVSELRERIALKRYAAGLLNGDSLASRLADPSARTQAYQLLGIAHDVVRAQGALGLAIIIDEVESIYTKLPMRLSRLGAFRVLASLCSSPLLSHSAAAIAVTPDGWRQLKGIDVLEASYGSVASEPVQAWHGTITRKEVPVIECRPLSPSGRRELLARIAVLYCRAYPMFNWKAESDRDWNALVESTARSQTSVRFAVRGAVDFLDLRRCNKRTQARMQSE